MSNITWGLQRDITPRPGARLVQEGKPVALSGWGQHHRQVQ